MSKQAEVIRWRDSHSDATIEGAPRVEIVVIKPIMVAGKMAKAEQRVSNVPEHMAKALQRSGRATVMADGV